MPDLRNARDTLAKWPRVRGRRDGVDCGSAAASR